MFKKGNKWRFQKGHKIGVGNKYTLGKHWKVKDTSKMKGRHNSPKTEIKKGQHLSPKTEFQIGHFPSKKTKEKLRLAKLGDKNPAKRPEVREKLRLARLKQKFLNKNTSIELKVKKYLDEHKTKYIQQFNLGNKFQCDFYIPFLNLIVECDGTYWHSLPNMIKRDKLKNAYAKKLGFNMLRLTEEQINRGQIEII